MTTLPRSRLVLALALPVLLLAAAGAAGGTGSGDDARITYWSDEPWPSIWTVRPDGSGRHRILRTRQNAKRPRLSPDHRWVAFDGAPPGKAALRDFDVQLVRPDGTGRRTLVRGPQQDVDPQWSPDGRRIAFTRVPAGDWTKAWTWTVGRDGQGLRRVARGQFGRWSPDGSHIVVDAPTTGSQGDLFVVDVDGRGHRLLLASPALDQPADWSPDGSRILFTRYDARGRPSVCVVGADGAGVMRLGPGIAGSFSPDGSMIVYAGSPFPGRIFVARADGTASRPVPGVLGGEPDWR